MADQTTPPYVSKGTNEGVVLDDPVLRIDKGRVKRPEPGETETRAPHVDHIPWGYGRDRLTAMVVDPNRLYAYWELTDPAIEKARQSLGQGGKDAWLNLRIYDISGRIFDGTNAHSYFDIKVDRSDRQWFVHIGKPASSHLVEIGLKSYEGYFVKIVRSGRADFPRFEPSPDGTVDWLNVRTATGPVGGPARGSPPGGAQSGGPPGVQHDGGKGGGGGGLESRARGAGAHGAVQFNEWSWTGWQELFHTKWQELFHTRWVDGHRVSEWSTPLMRYSWEAGPFPTPAEPPTMTEEHFEGPVTVFPLEGGRTRVVFGPWQVVIRGIGGRAESRVISRWEMAASWVSEVGFERVVTELSPSSSNDRDPKLASTLLGGSEAIGASERRWLAGSEVRLRGASELHLLGASEILMRGASEVIIGGASERRMAGGSESIWRGASEHRIGGASEMGLLGASENVGLGASDTYWLGASERALGASEGKSGGRAAGSPFAVDERDGDLRGHR